MTHKVKRICSMLLVAAMLAGFGSAGLMPAAGAAFSDTENHWAGSAIARWAQLGILKGMGTDNFYPDKPITRAELCVIVARVFNAQQKGDLSAFTDISPTEWYYHDVALAYKMGIINGTSEYTLAPDDTITRQDATVIIARALGLTTENTSVLGRFSDNDKISDYARRNIAAMLGAKYIKGFPDFTFAPMKTISRAEAITIINNIVSTIVDSQSAEPRSYNGTVLLTRAGISLSGSNITGDLIIADGVGTGNVSLSNVTISGKLIIRGGGPNSVEMSNVRVGGGVFVSNPTCATRLNVTSSSALGTVTARTPVIYLGSGATAFVIPSDAARGNSYSLSGNGFESLDVSGPAARIALNSGSIDNTRFLPGSESSTLIMESGSRIKYLLAGSPNVTVTGSGGIGRAEITQNGAVIDQKPAAYSITDNLSAYVGGTAAYGRITDNTDSNVPRSDASLPVIRDAVPTGGSGIKLATANSSSGNIVSVSQSGEAVPVSLNYGRNTYWIGLHIPAPALHTGPAERVKLTIDGSDAYRYNVDLTDVSASGSGTGVTGLTVYLPARRQGASLIGVLDYNVYIHWSGAIYESLYVMGSVTLAAPTAAQELALVDSYRSGVFAGYGETYTGSEAMRRLLLTDNALGIDLRSYETFDEADQASIAVQMYSRRAGFTAKQDVQDCLFSETVGKGALYAVNRAMNAEQVKAVFEDDSYASQLGIDSMRGSKYGMLSQASRLAVARAVLLARGTDFTSEAEIADIFNKMTDDLRTKETSLIAALNNARTKEDFQKLLEVKDNADLLGINIDTEPYKSLAAAKRTAAAQEIMLGRPFASLDAVRTKFIEIVGEPVATTPETDRNIQSVAADPSAVTIAIGDTATVTPTIKTASGEFKSFSAVTWTVDKTDVASVSSTNGEVYGRAKGKAKITLVSTVDAKKKTSVTINVVEAVPSTGITLSKPRVEVGEGGAAALSAALIPAKSTDVVSWYSDNPDIAVYENGRVNGIKPGKTALTARTPTGFSAVCDVWVTSKDPSVILDRPSATVGIRSSVQLEALVSPITVSNRAVKWTTSNNQIATVDAAGKVTGVAGGTVTVTATSAAYPALSASCAITVDATVRGISLDVDKLTLYKNGIYSLNPIIVPSGDASAEIDWNIMSGGKNIINVTDAGVVQAISAGTAQVIASLKDDPSVYSVCDVEVLSTALKFTMNAKTVKLNVGDNYMLTGTFTPANIMNKKIDYSSANPAIASVDTSGKIVGVSAGKVRLYAKPQADQSLEQFIDVTVTEVALKKISFANPTVTTYRRGQFDLKPIFDPVNATAAFQPLRWETEDDAIVDVNNGHVVANRTTFWDEKVPIYEGKVIIGYETKKVDHPIKITVVASDGKSAVCNVSVRDEDGADIVDSIEILLDKWIFQTGTRQNVNVAFNAKDKTKLPPDMKITWENPDPDIAYVGTDNYLNAVAADNSRGMPGKANIVATSADAGKSDNKMVIVANEGVSRITIDGLTSTTSYDGLLRMDTTASGKTKNVTATPTTQGSADKRLIWEAFEPVYDNGKPTNVPQKETNGLVKKSTVVSVTFDENTGKAVLTALSPGWARVTVQPYQKFKYGTKKPSEMTDDELKQSDIRVEGDRPAAGAADTRKFFSPYFTKKTVVTGPAGSETTSIVLEPIQLDPQIAIPAVLENKVTNGANEFWVYVAPIDLQGVSFDNPNPNVAPGGRVTVSATFTPNNAIPTDVTWFFDNTVVKEISREVTAGQARITFEALKGGATDVEVTASIGKILAPDGQIMYAGKEPVTATARLTVDYKPVTSVTITNKPAAPGNVLYKGDSLQLSVSVQPENASYGSVVWSSGDGTVLTVSQTGLVASIGSGTRGAVITVKTKDPVTGAELSDTVTIISSERPAVTNVTLPDSLELPLYGEAGVAAAVTKPEAYHDGLTVTWTLDPDDDTVQLIPGADKRAVTLVRLKEGDVKLTVTVGGELSNECVITTPTVQSASAPAGFMALPVGAQSVSLASFDAVVDSENPAVPTYESQDSGVITVAPDGTVTGKRAGKANILVRQGSNTRTVSVTVVPDNPAASAPYQPQPPQAGAAAPQKIDLRSSAGVLAGGSITLAPYVTPANADKSGLVWTSSAPGTASVSPGGAVTGVKAGKAVITVKDASGKLKASCTVTVAASDKTPVTSITLKKTSLDLKAGASSSLSVAYAPKSPAFKGITWISSNESVARVEPNGKVTAISSGTCVITAVSDSGGKTASCTVNVVVPVKSVSLSVTAKQLKAGEGFNLTVSFNPGDCTNKSVTWKSSSSAVATVAPDGTVTAHKPGKTTITVTSADGKKTAACRITVTK